MNGTSQHTLATGYRPEPVSRAFARLVAGEDEWIVLGNFLDDWYRSDTQGRVALVADPIVAPTNDKARRWAALFTAVVEWLCWTNEPRLNAPAWTADGVSLADPWFVEPSVAMRVWQLVHSPAPFRMRNVFTDASIVSRA